MGSKILFHKCETKSRALGAEAFDREGEGLDPCGLRQRIIHLKKLGTLPYGIGVFIGNSGVAWMNFVRSIPLSVRAYALPPPATLGRLWQDPLPRIFLPLHDRFSTTVHPLGRANPSPTGLVCSWATVVLFAQTCLKFSRHEKSEHRREHVKFFAKLFKKARKIPS